MFARFFFVELKVDNVSLPDRSRRENEDNHTEPSVAGGGTGCGFRFWFGFHAGAHISPAYCERVCLCGPYVNPKRARRTVSSWIITIPFTRSTILHLRISFVRYCVTSIPKRWSTDRPFALLHLGSALRSSSCSFFKNSFICQPFLSYSLGANCTKRARLVVRTSGLHIYMDMLIKIMIMIDNWTVQGWED